MSPAHSMDPMSAPEGVDPTPVPRPWHKEKCARRWGADASCSCLPKTPVPLDEIEAARAWYSEARDQMIVAVTTSDRDAVCAALRIAVEGLDRVERWYVCKNVEDDGFTCRGFTDDSTGWCGWCSALDAIEQVNRLVDLRPVVEGDGSGHVLPPFDPNVERMDEL